MYFIANLIFVTFVYTFTVTDVRVIILVTFLNIVYIIMLQSAGCDYFSIPILFLFLHYLFI